jgi:hypothetical protein
MVEAEEAARTTEELLVLGVMAEVVRGTLMQVTEQQEQQIQAVEVEVAVQAALSEVLEALEDQA